MTKTYTFASEDLIRNGEQVFAIFKPQNPISPFLVCTYSRGVVQGQPILGRHDAQAVEFEPEK